MMSLRRWSRLPGDGEPGLRTLLIRVISSGVSRSARMEGKEMLLH